MHFQLLACEVTQQSHQRKTCRPCWFVAGQNNVTCCCAAEAGLIERWTSGNWSGIMDWGPTGKPCRRRGERKSTEATSHQFLFRICKQGLNNSSQQNCTRNWQTSIWQILFEYTWSFSTYFLMWITQAGKERILLPSNDKPLVIVS